MASRFCAAIRPTASMTFGLSSAIWFDRYGRQLRYLVGFRIPVARRAALENIGDEHGLARQADGQQHGVEQLARATDERLALPVFLGTRRFADYQPLGARVADTEDRLRARLAQVAGRAARDALAQHTPVGGAVEAASRSTGVAGGAETGTSVRASTTEEAAAICGIAAASGGEFLGTQRSIPSASR